MDEFSKAELEKLAKQGQLNGIIKMMEEGKDCKDVITQISASKSSLQRLMGIIISEN
ncbi:metal-sensing transcriptional repressor, partial [Staphylococcus aureus]|nr:metal-sensing transcriptional repressor [Staphylococcus aureus]MBO8509575.1 metal-sensing transcriptional repressor [Staphylococcus aureus]